MKKHLFTLFFATILLAACTRDQVEPIPERSLVPYAIYELNNSNFDTSAPRKVTEFSYSSQGLISTLRERIYIGNQFDRTYYFDYNQQGEVISLVHNSIEWTRYNYFYQNGKVRYTTSNYGSSEFLFDGSNRMRIRIDTSGPKGNSYRADSLLYNYTDSGVTIRRIIQLLRTNTIGEAQVNYLFFDKAKRNPFENIKSDLECMPFSLIGLIDNLRFKTSAFVSMYKMVDRSGRIDFKADFAILKERQDSNYPELIKVNYNSFGTLSEFYLYILYREL
jgi:hypothetical protein